MNDLRHRLLIIFESGTVEELAAVLQLLYLLSIRSNNEPVRIFTPSPALNRKCKAQSQHAANLCGRN